jgi:heme-degrading monooxygenase HmoA
MKRKEQAMYASIRKYYIIPGTAEEFLRRVQGGFVPLISQVPGFQAYYVLQVRDDEVISVSIFDTQAGAEDSVRRAAEWVAKNIASFIQGLPEITAGQVKISQLDRGLAVVAREIPLEHLSAAWIETLQEQAQIAQSLTQELQGQMQKQRETLRGLAQEAVTSYFDMLQAAFPSYPPSLRLTENLRICLLALASRYPHHLVDIKEAVLGPQRLGAEGWQAADLIELLQHTAPQLLQARVRLEVTGQRKGIYLLERSEQIPAFWVHCGEAGEEMPPARGNMTARQVEQSRQREEAAGATAAGKVGVAVG